MRSGWPHPQGDHGRLQADERRAPFGPDISWPTGYSDLEYRDGDYRYPAAPNAPEPSANTGEHPYAAFSGAGYDEAPRGYGRPSAEDYGYGDPGYSDPRYDGPASQDAGIAGTRTVRGFVETPQGQSGYALSAPTAQDYGYDTSGHIELAYPLSASQGFAASHGAVESYQADAYRQPWDYEQPLRYDGDEPAYPAPDGYGQSAHGAPDSYGPGGYHPQAYDAADYNGSSFSRPGIDGPGYDLSGIIGTADFPAIGYDEPSYDRLSYDDPRYDDRPAADARRDAPGTPRFDDTRFDMPRVTETPRIAEAPRFDDTRLDSLWLSNEDVRQDEPVGYGNDGFDTDGPLRSGYPDSFSDNGPAGFAGHRPALDPAPRRFDETRFDLRVDDVRMDHTRFDVPAYDQTRVENMRALRGDNRRSATDLLPRPEHQPLNWPNETMLDDFVADFDLDEELEQEFPAAYVRTAQRPGQAGEDTRSRRGTGRRRGRSGDRRQWMALGAIAIVAAGAIGGVLMKYVFSGPSGPAHTVVAPSKADGYSRMPNLEKEMKVDQLRSEIMKTSAGQASNLVSAVYAQGSTSPGAGGNADIFMFVGGKLSSASPPTSIANFTQTYPGARVVPAGPLGGEAACAEATTGGEGVAMCVFFDNDSFGELVSPTMTTAKLATTLDAVRPSLELYAK